ncbi:MAG: alpha-2-macroglobulin family protein [Hymenobacter sp.]
MRYRVRVPQFSGALRVMAVAYKDDAFANAEQTMKVADPVVISTALPRFMSPGDTIDVPVTLTNTTKNVLTGTAEIWLNSTDVNRKKQVYRGALSSFGSPAEYESAGVQAVTDEMMFPPDRFGRKVELMPGKETRALFHIKANQIIGNSIVKVIFRGPKETFSETTEIPVRPAAPLAKRTGSGVVARPPRRLPLNLTHRLPAQHVAQPAGA